MILETGRLFLKSPHEMTGAAVAGYYLRNREFLREYSPERADAFYTEAFQEGLLRVQQVEWKAQMSCRFFICRKEAPEEVIGSVALNSIIKGAFQSCFLGYQLDGEHINRGYMTEAVRRVVRFAFEELKLHRVEGNVIPGNAASRAVLQKCGFVNEGISRKYLKINGKWEDHMRYVLLNEEME